MTNYCIDMYKPKCTEPILIFNRYVQCLAQRHAFIYLDGEFVSGHLNPFLIKDLLSRASKFDDNQLDNSYCQIGNIKEPLFIFAPCGHCDLCRHSKQVDIINRVTLESQTWECPPFFFTLTYDDEHLPSLGRLNTKYSYLSRGELCYKDVQDFFKRLRINWTRKGLHHDIRYLVSGEYGHLFGRPHYHVILFNNPYKANELEPFLFNQLKDDIFNAWSMCRPEGFDFGQCRGGAASYATKYVLKPQEMHGHMVKPFVRMSSGKRGGLGSIFFQKYIDYLRNNSSVNYLEYVDKDGRYQYMYLSKTFNKKVWPSPSALVPFKIRNIYKQFTDNLSLMVSLHGISKDDAFALSDVLRPSSELTNSFQPSVTVPVGFSRGFCNYLYISRLGKVLDGLIDDLVNYITSNNTDNQQYIDRYYKHKSLLVTNNVESLAPLVVKVRQKLSVILDKSSL